MNDTTQFDLMSRTDLSRIQGYFEFLYEIMKAKNQDSDKSPEGGASCYYQITVKVKEIWI